MYEAGEIAVRDACDIACARREDPKALKATLEYIDDEIVEDITATMANLPQGWSDDGKRLINAKYAWTEEQLTQEVTAALANTP